MTMAFDNKNANLEKKVLAVLYSERVVVLLHFFLSSFTLNCHIAPRCQILYCRFCDLQQT